MAVPRTQFYHPARVIDGALHAIDRAIRRAESIALVVGPPGTGKSLLLARIAESVGDDFRVALLSGARICTRRALWQSILVDLGQPYRGIDEAELRITLAELVRGLAASGSGLVILVDESHTLPLRLVEELRLLANMPTPLPAVHIVLAGPAALEERLGSPKMESFAQRVAVRAYLEPLDHAETRGYLRTQTRAAGLDWDKCFEPGCDDAVFSAADGVPRLMNQICDQCLVLAAAAGRRVRPADIAAAWQEIQRLPSAALLRQFVAGEVDRDLGGDPRTAAPAGEDVGPEGFGDGYLVREHGGEAGVGGIEFGMLDDLADADLGQPRPRDASIPGSGRDDTVPAPAAADPWSGPDVEFVFDAATDPFQEFFEQEERIVERYVVRSTEDFSRRTHVASADGAALVRQLAELDEGRPAATGGAGRREPPVPDIAAPGTAGGDDADMVVIEEDLLTPAGGRPAVAAVRLGDYGRLFARLRRGG